MSDLPERETRDALAEALWRAVIAAEWYTWASADEALRAAWTDDADRLLKALPSVGLEIGRSKSR